MISSYHKRAEKKIDKEEGNDICRGSGSRSRRGGIRMLKCVRFHKRKKNHLVITVVAENAESAEQMEAELKKAIRKMNRQIEVSYEIVATSKSDDFKKFPKFSKFSLKVPTVDS